MIDERKPKPAIRRSGRPRSDKKHQSILKAARREFSLSGYGDASMDAIAAKADVSKRTLYNHFASKEALFRAIVGELVAQIHGVVAIVYNPRLGLHEQLKQYALQSIEFTSAPRNLQLLRAVMSEHIRDPALVEPAFATYWESEYGFAAWIEAACKDGRLRTKSTVEASHIFASLMRGTIVWPLVLGRAMRIGKPQEKTIDEAIDMFLRYYGAAHR